MCVCMCVCGGGGGRKKGRCLLSVRESTIVKGGLARGDRTNIIFKLVEHTLHTHGLDFSLLQAGRILLPTLIEFYQWLHSDLAYIVTEEQAHSMTTGSVIAEASKHYYSAAGRKDLNALYKQLKGYYILITRINITSVSSRYWAHDMHVGAIH